MGLKITQLGIEISGKIVRNYSEATGNTTLVLNEDQVREVSAATDQALKLFDVQSDA